MSGTVSRRSEPRPPADPSPWAGVPWLLLAVGATALFVRLRADLDKAHAALGYLLIVLGASSRLGRTWGLALAVLCFLAFNFFLLPPYYSLVIANPLDWLVLASFLVTGAVAAQLLYRAQTQARVAQARAAEVDRFSVVGAEALGAGRAEEGVQAIARALCQTLHVASCDIFLYDAGVLRRIASASTGAPAPAGAEPERLPSAEDDELLNYAARHGAVAVQLAHGGIHVDARQLGLAQILFQYPESHAVLVPLTVRARVVGVLRLAGPGTLRLDAAQGRFAEALAYYAALGVERVRLVAEAERAAALREADRLKDALLATVSHDLRTPLTSIRAIAEEMRGLEDGALVIEEEAERLNRFVSDLLDLSRLNSGSLAARPELVAAEDLIGAALQQVSGAAAGHDIRARVPDGEILVGRLDFVLALRALVNLIENACKYSTDGAVEVTAERRGDELAFDVADRGPGIPAAQRDRMFEPFHRGQRPSDAGGTGLGLSIARRLAQAQGGDIRYEPRAGGGSIFTLIVPAADLAGLA